LVFSVRAAQIEFDIPGQPLPDALLEFYRQSRKELVFRATEGIAAIKTQSVQGKLEPWEALAIMLRGTPFVFTQDRGVLLVGPPASPSHLADAGELDTRRLPVVVVKARASIDDQEVLVTRSGTFFSAETLHNPAL